MSKQIQIFQNEEFGKVRVIEIDGTPWFVGKDVATILGYENTSRDVNRHVDAEDKGTTEMVTPGGKQKITIINESGLYSLILSSKLPSAKKFKRWVTSEILPSIRKHGAYIVDEVLTVAEQSQEFALDLFKKLQEERGVTEALRGKVDTLEPKAWYCDVILSSAGAIPISIIAKDYGVTATKFNLALHRLGIQYKVGGAWLLYKEHDGKGYTRSRTYITPTGAGVVHTCWTQKGRMFIYETLKSRGILPLVEIEQMAM